MHSRIKHLFNFKDIERTFSLLGPYIVKNRKLYSVLLLLLLFSVSMTVAFAWFIGKITDAAVQGDFNQMRWLVPIGFSIIIVNLIVSYFDTYIESMVTNKIKLELKNTLLKHIMLLPMKNISNTRTGDLLTHFTNDINCINGVIGSNLLGLIHIPLTLIAAFIYMVNINWQLSILTLLVTPIGILGGAFFGILIRNNSRALFDQVGNINSNLNEVFHGISLLRSFLLEKILLKKFHRQTKDQYDLEIKNAKLHGFFNFGAQGINSFTYILSLCLGAYFVLNETISVGSLLSFVTLMQYTTGPLTGIASQWGSFQSSASAVERISKVLDQNIETNELPSYYKAQTLPKTIDIYNIHFSYDDQKAIFSNFNLNIPIGKLVAFVGPSGAGKTTLFNLIQGFYKPQSGQILMDDVSINEISPSVLRSSFAYVAQETFLFSGTIKENLLLARPNLTDLEITNAAINANIHNFIMSLPNQYDTEIGERGVRLSGGQKQRIAIARAILKDAPILLLDEATSALDSESEFQVKEALNRLMKNKTTLVIAHRLSTIQHADLIIVMDEGRIVQQGAHEELMSQDGLYRKLTQTQFLTNQTNSESHLSVISN
ncbi:ABC transporter ATP-binding protein [Metabacillus herbersteinensis]